MSFSCMALRPFVWRELLPATGTEPIDRRAR
jgi:hypothetical protein